MNIPQTLINFEVFKGNADRVIGTADVTLPDFENMTSTVSGAGIAGELNVPIMGMYSSMKLTINFRTVVDDIFYLSKNEMHEITVRGAIQVFDQNTGKNVVKALSVFVKALPMKTGLGKLQAANPMDSSIEMEIVYIKVSLDGSTKMELDKLNYVVNIDGDDNANAIARALGLA